MKNKIFAAAILLSLPLSVFASSNATSNNVASWWSPSRIYVGAYGGYGDVSGAYKNDGQVTQGRLTLGLHTGEYKAVDFGAEFGVQSGNNMRLQTNAALITASGGLPIQSTLKPLADLLVAMKTRLSCNYPIDGILKGGIAYRQLQLSDISSSRDGLRKIAPELQIGLGLDLTNQAMLTVFYQGIYAGSTAGVALDSSGSVTISQIPTQQSVFLGLEYKL